MANFFSKARGNVHIKGRKLFLGGLEVMDNKVNSLKISNSQFSSPVASQVSTEISTEIPEGSIRSSKDLQKRVIGNKLAMSFEMATGEGESNQVNAGEGEPNQVKNSSTKPNQQKVRKLTEQQKQKIKQAIKDDIAPKIAAAVVAFLSTKVSELAKAALKAAVEFLGPIIGWAVNVHDVLANITSGLKEFFEKTGRALAKVEVVEKILSKVGLILKILETAADVLEDGKITRNDIIRVICVNVFGWIGEKFGAFLGTKAGKFIGGLFGGVGAVIGGPIGMVLGSIIGGYLGGEFGNLIAGKIGDLLGPDYVIRELWKDEGDSAGQASPKAASAAANA